MTEEEQTILWMILDRRMDAYYSDYVDRICPDKELVKLYDEDFKRCNRIKREHGAHAMIASKALEDFIFINHN